MGEQLSFFEPTGLEVIHLAMKLQRQSEQEHHLALTLYQRGLNGAAKVIERCAEGTEQQAASMFMLAEFEALGGVS